MGHTEYELDDASTDIDQSSTTNSSRYVSTSSPPSPQRLFSPGNSKHDSAIELSSLLSSTDRSDIDLTDEPSFNKYSTNLHNGTVTPSQPPTPTNKRIDGAHRVYAEFTRKHIKSRSDNVDYSEVEVEPQPLAARKAPYSVRFIESLHPKAHYGYFIVIFLAPTMNIMACQGTTFGVGFYSSHLIEELGITRSGISLCWAIALFITAFIIPFVGRLFDTVGARRTAIASLPIYCGACYLFSTVTNVYTMTLSFIMLRLLCTIWQLFSSYLVNQWFVKHRVVAMTTFQCLSAVSLAFPVLLGFYESLFGWRGSLKACAVMYAIVCSILCILAVDNPEKVGRKPDCVRHDSLTPSPSKVDLQANDADVTPSHEQQVPIVVEEPRLTAASVVDADDVEIHWMYQDALRTPLFWTVVVASIIISMLWSSYNFHYKQMWKVQQVEETSNATYEHLFLIVTVTNFICMAIAGAIFAKIKNKARAMVMGSVMCFVSQILLMTAHSYTQAVGFALAYGWMDGVYITGYLTVFAATFGRANVGTIDSVASATLTMACGLGPLAFGYDFDTTGNFNAMYYTVLVVSVLSTIMLAFVKVPPPPPEHRRLKLDAGDSH